MIKHLTDLANLVGAADQDEASIAKRLYKDTRCGISFSYTRPLNESYGTVTVAGYAEGVDAECPEHTLSFPFTVEAFWEAVKVADQEGCDLYDEYYEEDEAQAEQETLDLRLAKKDSASAIAEEAVEHLAKHFGISLDEARALIKEAL